MKPLEILDALDTRTMGRMIEINENFREFGRDANAHDHVIAGCVMMRREIAGMRKDILAATLVGEVG